MEIDLTTLKEKDTTALLFAENSGFLLQSELDLSSHFGDHGVDCHPIGKVTETGKLTVQNNQDHLGLGCRSISRFVVFYLRSARCKTKQMCSRAI